MAACPASGSLRRPSGVAAQLASFPQPSLKPGLTGVLCSHSKGSIESSQMQAGVGSCPAPGTAWSAGVAQPTKCQRALPVTELWSPTLMARARSAEMAPAGTLWKEIGGVLPPPGVEEQQQALPRQASRPRRQAGHSQVTPKFLPKGLASWVVRQLPHYLLPRRGQRVGPARESPERQVGWSGRWALILPEGGEGAREPECCRASLPPHPTAQVEPPRGHLCQGKRELTSVISSPPRPSPPWLSTHPPGGTGEEEEAQKGLGLALADLPGAGPPAQESEATL